MRVVCDNCGASYRIPEHKLVRDVNKATCRKCGDPMIIHKRGTISISDGKSVDQDAETQVTDLNRVLENHGATIPVGPNIGHGFGPTSELHEDLGPPTVAQSDSSEHTIPRHDLGPPTTASEPVANVQLPPQKAKKPPKAREQSDTVAELSVVMMANFAVIAGAVIMAWATQELHSIFGLFIILWGAVTSLSIVVSSDRGRKSGALMVSTIIGLVMAGGTSFAFYSLPQTQVATVAVDEVDEVDEVAEEVVEEGDFVDAEEGEEQEGEDGETEDGTEEEVEEPEAVEASAQAQAATTPNTVVATSGSGRYGSQEGSGGGSSSNTTSSGYSSSTASNSSSSRSTEPSSSSRSSGSSSSSRNSSSSSRSSGSSSSSGGSSSSETPAATGVSLPVLDTMLRTNRNVKQCFLDYRNETGVMPSGRIYVRIRIAPSGRPTSASINSGEYSGTSLDECLGLEIQEIQFPPFEGDTTTYNYPFQL